MDLIRLRIPSEFIRARVRMNWREVQFGLKEELLDPKAPIRLAVEQLADDGRGHPVLVALAGISAGEDVQQYVEELAAAETAPPYDEIRAKWLYVVLAWILEHKAEYADPLQTVEEVYADFDYPERIARFVRYMPSDEPPLDSLELNEARLFDKWRQYLNECSSKYAADLIQSGGT